MGKRKVTDIVVQELTPFLDENGYELFLTEYVKEGKDWFLRIYIDSENGVSIADCKKVSEYISKRLDELDPIESNYFLEVSSPGLDRPLIKDSDYEKYKGKLIEIMLYKSIDGKKQLSGELVGLIGEAVVIKNEKGEMVSILRDVISKVKLAVIF